MYKCILPMLQVGPLKPVDEQSQVKPPLPSLEHSPLFLQGLEPQGSKFINTIRKRLLYIYVVNFVIITNVASRSIEAR